ncbi:MAG: plasmid pRiA4b ORF-3 family protein [Elusimicrobiota bacterium]
MSTQHYLNLPILQIKLTLKEINPPVWRRLLVPSNLSLHEFHWDIQRAMGWENCHLYQFTIDGVDYGVPHEDDMSPLKSAETVSLSRFGRKENFCFSYEYDFGDGWDHEVLIEKILPANSKQTFSVCLEGERACPPEDCGGPYGYTDLLKILSNPKHQEYRAMREWVGKKINPEFFDLKGVNRNLKRKVPVDLHLE